MSPVLISLVEECWSLGSEGRAMFPVAVALVDGSRSLHLEGRTQLGGGGGGPQAWMAQQHPLYRLAWHSELDPQDPRRVWCPLC